MEKKVTPMSIVTKSVAQEVPAYNWKSQGADTVKFGTSGTTSEMGRPFCDSWTD